MIYFMAGILCFCFVSTCISLFWVYETYKCMKEIEQKNKYNTLEINKYLTTFKSLHSRINSLEVREKDRVFSYKR